MRSGEREPDVISLSRTSREQRLLRLPEHPTAAIYQTTRGSPRAKGFVAAATGATRARRLGSPPTLNRKASTPAFRSIVQSESESERESEVEEKSKIMQELRRRRGSSATVAAALVLAACLGQGTGSSPGYPGAGGGAAAMPQRPGQQVRLLCKGSKHTATQN